MPVKVNTRIEIDAPIDKVWQVISDLNTWNEWNKGEILEGFNTTKTTYEKQKGSLKISWDMDGKWDKRSCLVDVVDHEKKLLRWGADIPVMFKGRHWFQLTSIDDGKRTLVENNENLGGLLPLLRIGLPYGKAEPMDNAMNKSLKDYVEKK